MDQLVAELRADYLKVFSDHLKKADEKPFYVSDLLMFGLMDRNIGLLEALPPLFESENIHALAPLLRVQLDGLLRLHAFRVIEKRDDFALHIIKGGEVRKFRDSEGNPLTDRYLVNSLKEGLPWVEPMYDNLCGWVHFTESHVFSAVSEGKGKGQVEIGIGSYRKRVKPALLQEATDATRAIHKATIEIINAYFSLAQNV